MRNTKEVYKVKDWKDWDHNYNLGQVSWSQRIYGDSDQQNDDYVFKVENKDPKTFQDVKVFGGKNFTGSLIHSGNRRSLQKCSPLWFVPVLHLEISSLSRSPSRSICSVSHLWTLVFFTLISYTHFQVAQDQDYHVNKGLTNGVEHD